MSQQKQALGTLRAWILTRREAFALCQTQNKTKLGELLATLEGRVH